MMETWKQYKNTNYEVSDWGNVRRIGSTKNRKPQDNGHGYLYVSLRVEGKNTNFYIHRMVAETFIENKDNKEQVNHIDENKANNHVSNLEWMTKEENLKYGTRTKRSGLTRGKRVCQLTLDGEFISSYNTAREASRQTGINQGSISRCVKGERKTAGGYKWRLE